MNGMDEVTIEFPVHFTRGAAGRKEVNVGVQPVVPAVERGCVPRVAHLMALAIRFEELVRLGEVESHADLARLGQVTRARISQIMDLLCLAPDIQEEILFLPLIERERDAVSEHELRVVCAVADWREQRRRWRAMLGVQRPSQN
ncbi:MAG TPA: hypothetical protein PKE29_10170 [Phycisphaerales bacterium]|nr:hypothetical protein [Phycisphaerales bacterium]